MIAALLLACAPRVAVGDAITGDVPAPPDYAGTVRDATRALRLYDALTTTLFVRAVFLDAELRRAVEAERAHLLLLEEPARAERLAASLAEADAAHVFVFSADSQWREDLRFGFGDAEPWRVRLFAAGRPCTPESVTEVTPTPLDQALYPFHNRWSTFWSARFATDCGREGPFVLQITGPHGTGELGW